MLAGPPKSNNRYPALCIQCKIPLSGRQKKYCSPICGAKWHRDERRRQDRRYSITGAAKALGISRYAVAYAMEKKYINTILVPTAGRPRREVTLGEMERHFLARWCIKERKEKNHEV